MASKVSIISNAFILLGKKPINTLDLTNSTIVAASNIYELVLPDLLSKCPWRSAMINQTLSRVNETPNNNWQYIFQLPTDPKIIYLYNVEPLTAYEIYGDKLYTNVTEVKVDYVYKPPADEFPDYFVTLMVYAVAYHMASQITQAAKLTQFWYQRFLEQKVMANSISLSQIPTRSVRRDQVYSSHFVG
jgi:hypothetical protein